MASASFTHEDVSTLLECAICRYTVENPRRLACGHFYCKRCLDKWLEFAADGSCIIKCPKQCKKHTMISKKCTTSDLAVDYMLNGMTDMVTNDEKR